MSDAFEPGQLNDLIEWPKADGYRFADFKDDEGLREALSDRRTKLLLLASTDSDLPSLTQRLRILSDGVHDTPVIVYLKDHNSAFLQEQLPSEIDAFLVAPWNMEDVRSRVRLIIKPFDQEQEKLTQSQLNLISYFGMHKFIGTSPSFLSAINLIPRVAACDVTLLIVGDTGTGKEMCARATHYLSARTSKPLIPINCGLVPADLFENELFGHEPGAFTDARASKRGLIAEAEGGTLFLDEVDSLPLAAQVKLLRFIQDQRYKPLGASSYRQANIRVIAATNQSLRKKVEEGTFREDLYYRLNVVTLLLPPLQDRKEDIIQLAEHFLKTSAAEYDRPTGGFSHGAVQKLLSYSWPGNVRELENVIRNAVVLAEEPVIRAHDINLPVGTGTSPAIRKESFEAVTPAETPTAREPFRLAKARVVESFERNYLNEVLLACDGNISQAAREAKKNRRAFFALLKKHRLTQLSSLVLAFCPMAKQAYSALLSCV